MSFIYRLREGTEEKKKNKEGGGATLILNKPGPGGRRGSFCASSSHVCAACSERGEKRLRTGLNPSGAAGPVRLSPARRGAARGSAEGSGKERRACQAAGRAGQGAAGPVAAGQRGGGRHRIVGASRGFALANCFPVFLK